MPRLGLGIREYRARSQPFAQIPLDQTAAADIKLVDGKAKPCHDGMFPLSSKIVAP
jgi:hypothetical protein